MRKAAKAVKSAIWNLCSFQDNKTSTCGKFYSTWSTVLFYSSHYLISPPYLLSHTAHWQQSDWLSKRVSNLQRRLMCKINFGSRNECKESERSMNNSMISKVPLIKWVSKAATTIEIFCEEHASKSNICHDSVQFPPCPTSPTHRKRTFSKK